MCVYKMTVLGRRKTPVMVTDVTAVSLIQSLNTLFNVIFIKKKKKRVQNVYGVNKYRKTEKDRYSSSLI